MQPDIAFALCDTPFTAAPHSQKRLVKSIERSAAWLADLLRPVENTTDDSPASTLNVFVHMAGGTSTSVRRAFSQSLVETLHGMEANAVKPLLCLDEGVAGYAFDLAAFHVRPVPLSHNDRGGGIDIAENSLVLALIQHNRASFLPLLVPDTG